MSEAQAVLKNLTAVIDEDGGQVVQVSASLPEPTVEDYVQIAILLFLAVSIGGLMFRLKRHFALKAALDRDRRVLGDFRSVTRSRAT